MDGDFLELLRVSKVAESETKITHWSHLEPRAGYNIQSHNISGFWTGYCQTITQDDERRLYLAEKPNDIIPIISRISLSFEQNEDRQSIDEIPEKFLNYLIYAFQQAMSEYLQLDDEENYMCLVVKSREPYERNNHLIVEFLIKFPYCRVDGTFQMRFLRPRVIKILREKNVLSKLLYEPVQTWEDILDTFITKNPWILYGSYPSKNHPGYDFIRIYPMIKEGDLETGEIEEPTLEDVFRFEDHIDVKNGLISPSLFEDNPDVYYWLPLFFSLKYNDKECIILKKTSSGQTTPRASGTGNLGSSHTVFIDNLESLYVEFLSHLLPLINRDRLNNRYEWEIIGKAIYNIYEGSDEGFSIWFRLKNGEDENFCRNKYEDFKNNNCISLKTIAWMAREDSVEEYNTWHSGLYNKLIEQAFNLTHHDVALAVYSVYWLDHISASVERKKWYKYVNHRWHIDEKAISLNRKLSQDFCRKIELLRASYSSQILLSQSKDEKTLLEKKISDTINLIMKLKNVAYKSSIIKECINFFHPIILCGHQYEFSNFADTNYTLMGIKNGVIEIYDNKAIIRSGRPEDYLTRYSITSWEPDLNWDHFQVKECLKWMSQIFVELPLREYFLKLAASCLYGRNTPKKFWIMTGEGNNSKSKLKILFETTFGPYCANLPCSAITSKRSSSNTPTPELAQLKNARIGFLQEPDNDESIKTGRVKEFTGGDSFFARFLNENGGTIDVTFKMFLMCNGIPPIPHSDKAMDDRIAILPFLSTWVNDAPETEEEQIRTRRFKRDNNFDEKIKQMGSAFLFILTQYYPRFISEGLDEPEEMKKEKEAYCRDNDSYQQFIDERLEKVIDLNTGHLDRTIKLSYQALRIEFQNWYKENFPGKEIPPTTVIKQQFETNARLGKQVQKAWTGIRFKNLTNADSIPTAAFVART